MSNKLFEAGMIAGAKPFDEKFQKQANAFDKTADRLDGKLDDIKVVTDTLVDDGLARERKEVFGLNTLFDINSMEDTEKILVVSLLYTLAQRFEANDYQKNYIRSVQKYLGLKNIQPADTLTGVEGVKNFDDQKAILQVVMEYLFLECFSFDFLDEDDYEELFDSFNINRKGFREVETTIENIYQAVGVEGLAEKYGVITEEDTADDTNEDVPPTDELQEMENKAEALFLEFRIEESLELFNQLANYNYSRAMYFASEIYASGYGVSTINKEKATGLRQAGAELGDCLCILNVAFSITDPKERKTAVQKILPDVTKAAQNGDIFAQYELASLYNQGTSVEKDTDTALMWLNRSSDFWRSKYAIAYYHYAGIAVAKDRVKAFNMWEDVAKLGYPRAGHNCYVAMRDKMKATPDEIARSTQYLIAAAKTKLAASLYLLAEIYYEGLPAASIPQDRNKAKELLQLAAERGQKDAVKKLNNIESGKKVGFFSWSLPYYLW